MHPIVWLAFAIQFHTHELPRAIFGAPYHARISIQTDPRCPASDVAVAIAGGQLPRGIELAGDTLQGVPQEFGLFRVRLRAASACATAVEDFTLEVTGKPILRVSPTQLSFEMHQGDPPPGPQSLIISASWADLPYSVEARGAAWLSLHPNRGATPYAGSPYSGDPLSVEVTPAELAPGTYHAALHFWTDTGSNAPDIPVTFRVLPR